MRRNSLAIARILPLLMVGLLMGIRPDSVLAQHTYPATGSGSSLIEVRQKTRETTLDIVKSGLAAYDQTPLADRTPLVLVHGIGASASTRFNWDRFLAFTGKDKKFQSRYKIYLYHYDSSCSVPDISRNLQQTLHGFLQALGNRNIKILAYSEGGLLTRNAMQDSFLDQHTDEVITIATPFHGSPLANPDWIRQQIKTEPPFSIMRMSQRIAYRITGWLYPTFKEDFHWDNFDGAIPPAQFLKNNKQGAHTDYALAHKKRFVTYGSYFGMNVDPQVLPGMLGVQSDLPHERLMFSNLFRRNVLFSLVRNNIGKLPLALKEPILNTAEPKPVISPKVVEKAINSAAQEPDSTVKTATLMLAMASDVSKTERPDGPVTLDVPVSASSSVNLSKNNALMAMGDIKSLTQDVKTEKHGAKPVSMMVFNDGISPISSSLWLGRYMPMGNGTTVSVNQLWDTLKKLKGNENTRLFAGVDHRNWMDGTTRTHETKIRDLLNPDEPPRTIFGWIVYDLMS